MSRADITLMIVPRFLKVKVNVEQTAIYAAPKGIIPLLRLTMVGVAVEQKAFVCKDLFW